MGKYFGTDGFRGKANETLTARIAFDVGRYLGYYFSDGGKKQAKIALGKDTRLSSYMLESAVASGLAASGASVYLLHVITTPGVAYITRTEGFDCGIMITASHNPFTDNGIKLLSSTGEKISDEITDKIEEYIDGKSASLPYATNNSIGKLIDYSAGRNRYIGHLISVSSHSYKGLNIGLDCANGSAWMIAPNVFYALGANLKIINNSPTGENINYKCGATETEPLTELVRANRLDCGFAFDGDCDRCIAIDENGETVDGDKMLFIMAKHLKKNNQLPTNTVVCTLMSNTGFLKSLEAEGIDYELTDVGDRFVQMKMAEGGHVLGGEHSGHIILGKYSGTGDGILTAISVLEIMCEEKKSLAELCRNIKHYPRKLINVKVKNAGSIMNNKELQEEVKKISETDCRDGRLLLRKSGTEPVIRIMAEAPSFDICTDATERIKKIIERI